MTQHKFELKPSKIFMTLMFILFVGGEICVMVSGFLWWLTVMFGGFYGIWFSYVWWHYVLIRGEKTIVKFWHASVDNSWYLVNDKDDMCVAKLLPSTVVTPFILILHFEVASKFISVVVFKDMISAIDFRRLRVELIISN